MNKILVYTKLFNDYLSKMIDELTHVKLVSNHYYKVSKYTKLYGYLLIFLIIS